MNGADVSKQLSEITSNDDLDNKVDDLAKNWVNAGIGLDAVEPILRYMELNPLWDFGMPGALVHFVERYYGKGYERLLVESFSRRPTPHTAWMLNRVINGEKDSATRGRYLDLLKQAMQRNDLDNITHDQLKEFLSLH